MSVVGEGIIGSCFNHVDQTARIELTPAAPDSNAVAWKDLDNLVALAQGDIPSRCPVNACDFAISSSEEGVTPLSCFMRCGACNTETLQKGVNAVSRAVQDIYLSQKLKSETGEEIDPTAPGKLWGPSGYILTRVRARLAGISMRKYDEHEADARNYKCGPSEQIIPKKEFL